MSYLAEQNIIGSLFMDPMCISDIYNLIEPEMFANSFYGSVYKEFCRGYDRNYPVTAALIEQNLKSDTYSSEFIMQEVRKCFDGIVTSANVSAYADIVLKDYKARRLNSFLEAIRLSGKDVEAQIGDILAEIEVLQGRRKAKSKTLAEITKENKDYYFKEREIPRIELGFSTLDSLLGGLEGGDMIVIGARPAVGKSAFVTQITSCLAKQGKRVGFYNLEMQNKQMYERFVVSESGISLTRLRNAVDFLNDEKERFDKANEVLEKAENIIITTGSKTMREIRAESKHMDYDIIIIDYLQLLGSDKTYRGNRYAEVGAISKAIKALAMELNIPIIALSQLNRASEGRETKEPTMGELREAGDIEQDASVIILLWNLDNDDRSKKGWKLEKQRQGNTGKGKMKFNGEFMRFEEVDGSEFEPAYENPFVEKKGDKEL